MRHKLPAMPFYFGDWFKATDVRICSLEARGMWIDLLGLMWESDNPGYLSANGIPLNPTYIGRLIGISEEKVTLLLNELETNGVFSRTAEGSIYCRRMVKDMKKRELCSLAGLKGGGNPYLKTYKGRPKGEPVNEYVNDNVTELVDEIYKLYPSKRPNGSSTDKRPKDKEKIAKHLKAGIDLKALIELYTRKTNPEWYQALKTFLNGLPDKEELLKANDFKDQSDKPKSTLNLQGINYNDGMQDKK